MACKDCRGGGSTRVSDVRQLYNPSISVLKPGEKSGCQNKMKCGVVPPSYIRPKCLMDCRRKDCACRDKYKRYWSKNPEVGCPSAIYENQPWFNDPVIQDGWDDFIGEIVTPCNIGCILKPGPDDCQYKCTKVRSMMGPSVYCTWDLPDQDECATIKYGYNRDWRRYNEDQRKKASDIQCGCSDEPICPPPKSCEWPPYLGKPFGARYMGWAHPHKMMFPRRQVFNYQSLPKC